MSTSFLLSKVGPGYAEGVSAFYPAIKADRKLLGELCGKTVFLSRRPVGVVKSVDVYEQAGSALLKTEIHDREAQHMLGTGCLSYFELDSRTGALELRDRQTTAGDVFSFVRADGAELQKSFHHADSDFARDVQAEQDRRLQESCAKTLHPVVVNSNSRAGFGGGIPTTPYALRTMFKGTRNTFKSHNG
jgi:hypothetical protein